VRRRPPFDCVFMFKVLILQTMHALSDERCEYLIKDRLSFNYWPQTPLTDPVAGVYSNLTSKCVGYLA
jgi:transposase, IS5 family